MDIYSMVMNVFEFNNNEIPDLIPVSEKVSGKTSWHNMVLCMNHFHKWNLPRGFKSK